MLEWKDEKGEHIDYIGITTQHPIEKVKESYMKNVYKRQRNQSTKM